MNKYTHSEFFRKYKFGFIIIFVLVIPVLFISLLSFIVKWGTLLINTKELFIDIFSPIKIGDYLNYYISIVGIEVTSLLSYAIWITSEKSNKLSEDINNKEENRDNEKVRESALIIYYDLLSNISILRMLYSRKKLEIKTIEMNKLNIASDWVKNIANLRDVLTRTEIEKMYNLYNSFLLINELGYSSKDDNADIKKLIESLSKNIFIPVLLDYLWMDFHGATESILNSKYYMILRKIELASKVNINQNKYIYIEKNEKICVMNNDENIKYNGKFNNGMIETGIDEWYLDNGEILYSFAYENGKIVKGKFNSKFRGKNELIFDCEFDDNNIPQNGFVVIFNSPKNISYEGYIKSGIPHGKGKKYFCDNSNNFTFSGEWEAGYKIRGEFINKSSNLINYFNGEYRNNQPYSGEIRCSLLYKFNNVYGFEGIIHEGKVLQGNGYAFSKNIIDEEYKARNPLVFYEDEDEGYDDQYDYIPEELELEMHEDAERSRKEFELDMLKEQYGYIVELIKAEWNNGECKLSKDDILNKQHLYYSNSKKENIIL